MRREHAVWWLAGLLGLLLVVGCSTAKPRTGVVGKGGLPTNQVGEGAGNAGAALTVPPELLYPGATEIEGRPFFYQTSASVDTVDTWIRANLPGATPIDEDNKKFRTFRGTEWTLELYDNGGQGVIRYMSNKYLRAR